MKKECELCDSPARMYCESDRARLCWNCDSKVHSANFLVARHLRNLLCDVCQAPTPWRASGCKLGSTTASVCQRCVGDYNRRTMIQSRRDMERSSEGSNVDVQDDDDEDDDVEEVVFDEETQGSDEEDDEVEDDYDEDGENQVVPWSTSTSTPPPPASSSTSSDESFGRSHCCKNVVLCSDSTFSSRGTRKYGNLDSQDNIGCSSWQWKKHKAAPVAKESDMKFQLKKTSNDGDL